MCGGAFNRGIDGGLLTFSSTNGWIYASVSFHLWFVILTSSWVHRGGLWYHGSGAGVFVFADSFGSMDSFRLWFVFLEYPFLARGAFAEITFPVGLFTFATSFGSAEFGNSFRSLTII